MENYYNIVYDRNDVYIDHHNYKLPIRSAVVNVRV